MTAYPPTPYTDCALAALEHEGRIMLMARRHDPAIADAGQALINACGTRNYFKAAEAAQEALTITRDAFMPAIADAIGDILAIGAEKVARPFLMAAEVNPL